MTPSSIVQVVLRAYERVVGLVNRSEVGTQHGGVMQPGGAHGDIPPGTSVCFPSSRGERVSPRVGVGSGSTLQDTPASSSSADIRTSRPSSIPIPPAIRIPHSDPLREWKSLEQRPSALYSTRSFSAASDASVGGRRCSESAACTNRGGYLYSDKGDGAPVGDEVVLSEKNLTEPKKMYLTLLLKKLRESPTAPATYSPKNMIHSRIESGDVLEVPLTELSDVQRNRARLIKEERDEPVKLSSVNMPSATRLCGEGLEEGHIGSGSVNSRMVVVCSTSPYHNTGEAIAGEFFHRIPFVFKEPVCPQSGRRRMSLLEHVAEVVESDERLYVTVPKYVVSQSVGKCYGIHTNGKYRRKRESFKSIFSNNEMASLGEMSLCDLTLSSVLKYVGVELVIKILLFLLSNR